MTQVAKRLRFQLPTECLLNNRGRARWVGLRRARLRALRRFRLPEAGLLGLRRASASRPIGTGWVGHVAGDILCGLGFDTRLLKEPDVSGPVDEAILPGVAGAGAKRSAAGKAAANSRRGILAARPCPCPSAAPPNILGFGGRSRAQALTGGRDDPSRPRGFHSASLSLLAADAHHSAANRIVPWRRTPDGF